VETSTNSSLYGISWYLDLVVPEWQGMIKGNYDGVFPIITTKKYAIPILFQPVGLHKVAWYSKLSIEKSDYEFLINFINKSFAYAHINIGSSENIAANRHDANYTVKQRKSQMLNISDKPLAAIFRSFSQGNRYSIRKSEKMQVEIRQETNPQIFWKVAKESNAFTQGGIGRNNHHTVAKMMSTTLNSKSSQLWVAYHDRIPVSVGFLVGFNKVMYFLFLFTIDNGLKCCANHLMMKEIIKHNYGIFHTLDFAGSNIESIGFFNRSFGAKDSYSTEIELGQLLPFVKTQHFFFNLRTARRS
jgi:hypothetical protein